MPWRSLRESANRTKTTRCEAWGKIAAPQSFNDLHGGIAPPESRNGDGRQFEIDPGVSDPHYRELDKPILFVVAVFAALAAAVVLAIVAVISLIMNLRAI
jgi:hypothetical protein